MRLLKVIIIITHSHLFLSGWWFGTWMDYFSIQLWMSSSQVTNSIIFQRGRYTTNQSQWISSFFSVNTTNAHTPYCIALYSNLTTSLKMASITAWWNATGQPRQPNRFGESTSNHWSCSLWVPLSRQNQSTGYPGYLLFEPGFFRHCCSSRWTGGRKSGVNFSCLDCGTRSRRRPGGLLPRQGIEIVWAGRQR